MKNLFMILFMLGGFALSDAGAQANCNPANCTPCPPGCCIVNCNATRGSAAAVSTTPVEVAFTSFLIEGLESTGKDCNLTKKEMKACMKSCKTASTSGSNTTAVTNSAVCQPVPSCRSANNSVQSSVAVTVPVKS